MKLLVTGAAGFIGMHCAQRLLERGDEVLGIDNLSPYYSVELKKARLKRWVPEYAGVEASEPVVRAEPLGEARQA